MLLRLQWGWRSEFGKAGGSMGGLYQIGAYGYHAGPSRYCKHVRDHTLYRRESVEAHDARTPEPCQRYEIISLRLAL